MKATFVNHVESFPIQLASRFNSLPYLASIARLEPLVVTLIINNAEKNFLFAFNHPK